MNSILRKSFTEVRRPVFSLCIPSRNVATVKAFNKLSSLNYRFISTDTKLAGNEKTSGKKSSFTGTFLKTLGYSSLLAVTYFGYSLYREANPLKQLPQSDTFPTGQRRKTIVVLGSGWGAMSFVKTLDTTMYNVVVVSPRNYFLFTPLLPSAPLGTVDLKSIIEPVRAITRAGPGEVIFYEAEANDIDPNEKTLKIVSHKNNDKLAKGEELTLKYDYLIVGVGSQPTTFNIPGVLEHSSFLKEIDDAHEIRLKIMNSIEEAALLPPDDPERKRLLSFVVVGGGPTGVEFAADLRDYIDEDLHKWMPEISKEVSLTLVEGSSHLLNMFNKDLIKYTEDLFHKEKINLKLNAHVTSVNETQVMATHVDTKEVEPVEYGVLIWATGNSPRDIAQKLMKKLPATQTNRRGLLINDNLQLLGAEDSIYAIGDCTFHKGLFPTAQVAHQEGQYLSRRFNKLYRIEQLEWKLHENSLKKEKNDMYSQKIQREINRIKSLIEPFQYHHLGSLAYIGKEKAIADMPFMGKTNFTSAGAFTFLFWKSAYLAMFHSFRNRFLVGLDWAKVYFIGRDSSV